MIPSMKRKQEMACQQCGRTVRVTVSIQLYYDEDLLYHWVCPHCGLSRLWVDFRGALRGDNPFQEREGEGGIPDDTQTLPGA